MDQARFKDGGFSGEVLGDKGETGHLSSQPRQVHHIISLPTAPLTILLRILLVDYICQAHYLISCSYVDDLIQATEVGQDL